jgi:hypothetical protein
MDSPWRYGVPAAEAQERVECWSRIGHGEGEQWYRFIGTTSMHDGEVIILIADMEVQDFHAAPPVPVPITSSQVWRVLR